MRRLLLLLIPLSIWACKSTPTPPDGGAPADGGPHFVTDAGPDAGRDAGPDAGDGGPDGGPHALACSVVAQDCDAGASCLYVDGGPQTACLTGACDLLRQDCGGDQKCDYRRDDAGTTARACVAVGTAKEGEPCPTVEDPAGCAAGLLCVDAPGDAGTGVCGRLCNADPDCAPGQTCEERVGLDGTAETPSLCVALTPCDLFTQDCPTGSACYVGPSRPSCYPVGHVPLGGACAVSNDCGKGLVCAQDNQGALTCHALCETDGNTACVQGTCQAAQAPVPDGVGVCL